MRVQPGARRIAAVLSVALVLVGLGLVGRQVARIAAWTDELAWQWELEHCETRVPVAEHWKGVPLTSVRYCLALSELHPFWHTRYPWFATPTGNQNADMVSTVAVGLMVSLGVGAIPWGLLLLGRWIMEGFSPAGPAVGEEKQTLQPPHPPDSPVTPARDAPWDSLDEAIDEIGRDVLRAALDEEDFVAEVEERLQAILPEEWDLEDWERDEIREAYRRLTGARAGHPPASAASSAAGTGPSSTPHSSPPAPNEQ